ncbi:MAG: hypothetical protein GY832_18135 [Chloroflexi bacterium]|nr:hypothetical protein [Chloroflexota bacterium]
MKTGLLWFDDDPLKKLDEKVKRAVAHYQHKYGQAPTLCFVHANVFDGNGKKNGVKKAGGVEIRVGRSVLPHHFWLGMAEEKRRTRRK